MAGQPKKRHNVLAQQQDAVPDWLNPLPCIDSCRRDSAMPLLRELHWLPVHHRVTYKIAELTFKALHVDLSPTYLQQFVQVYTPARSLRSACSYTLVANRSRTVAGDCTFVHAAATVWNALPVSVTSKDSLLSFKAALKTHLCALAYT